MTGDELVAEVEVNHMRWLALIDDAGSRVDEPGAAGEWTLRDVIAHVNAYHRFLVLELGGTVRPFGDLPEHDGNDFQARNEVLHAADLDRSWSEVRAELDTVMAELVAQIRARSDAQLAEPMVDWAPMSIAQWVINLTVNHFAEHEADLRTFLAR